MPARNLTPEEIVLAQKIYGNTIDYSQVKVHDGKYFSGQPDNTAITPDGQAYFPTQIYSSNFGLENSVNKQALFIHELGHIFQYQNGMEVVEQRISEGAKYNYEDVFDGTPLGELTVEAQAEFFRDLFKKRIGAAIDPEKQDGWGHDYLDPNIPLSEYEAVLPSNFPGGNPAIPPLNYFDPYERPQLNGMLPDWLSPIVGMQVGNGSVFFPVGGGGGMEPLILDLDGNGAHTTKLGWVEGQSSTYFDMDNDGFAERTAWVAAGDGMLVIDKNGNGKIDNQNELFGNNATYADGFANLKISQIGWIEDKKFWRDDGI